MTLLVSIDLTRCHYLFMSLSVIPNRKHNRNTIAKILT